MKDREDLLGIKKINKNEFNRVPNKSFSPESHNGQIAHSNVFESRKTSN